MPRKAPNQLSLLDYEQRGREVHGDAYKYLELIAIDYTYLDVRTDRRLHKSGFQKSRLRKLMGQDYDEAKTEFQLTTQMGMHRIYDCGKTRWVYTVK